MGRTGLGPLYRAQYPAGPPVALTLLDVSPGPEGPTAAPAVPDRLVQQLRRACLVRHPNVAGLVEVGETSDGRAYAVAEFLTGRLLSDALATRGALPTREAVDICLQTAAGLSAAHQAGVVHADVSPRAILLTEGDDHRPHAKLIRFNLGSNHQPGRGSRGGVDERYASPGRVAGSTPTELDDVFGLGAVLHHLLTGAPPDGEAARATIPEALRPVVDRALAPTPDGRYPTVAAFADELAEAGKSARRRDLAQSFHPGVAGAAAALLAAVAWFGWGRPWVAGAHVRAAQETGMTAGESPAPAPTRSTALSAAVVKRPERRAPTAPAPKTAAVPGPTAKVPLAKVLPTKVVPGPTPAANPVATGVTPKPKRIGADSVGSPQRSIRGDSSSPVAISPFRRAHPWAALPGGRFYFPSSCPLALRSHELLYFASEAEARATGRTRSTQPGCS
ncbi:MAG TPA: protein kinase [Gemmatimonadales bacterium]|nr:protein kinase [Gemmatimonadales bacterium]